MDGLVGIHDPQDFASPAAPKDGVRRSPEYVEMSLAASMVLGLRPGRFQRGGHTRCLNLLLTYPEGCAANCAYCGLARDRQGAYSEKSFIRVEWPTVSTAETIHRAKSKTHLLERMCISMITHKRSGPDTLDICERWVREDALRGVPVSILSNPTTMTRDDLIDLRDAGAERFTVALDGVTAAVFDQTRGSGVKGPNDWDQYWGVYEQAFEVFGRENVGVHLICGMGETEAEMVSTMFRARSMGEYGCLQLFAFNPEDGSRMEGTERVLFGQFRRVQLARYLIDKGFVKPEDMAFNDHGQIVDHGYDAQRTEAIIDSGIPFRTSGCPGKECDVSSCNRPFGDGPPLDFSSYPFALDPWDVSNVRKQLADYDGSVSRAQMAEATLDQLEAMSSLPCRG